MKEKNFNCVDSRSLKYCVCQFPISGIFLTQQHLAEEITPIVWEIPAFQNLFCSLEVVMFHGIENLNCFKRNIETQKHTYQKGGH